MVSTRTRCVISVSLSLTTLCTSALAASPKEKQRPAGDMFDARVNPTPVLARSLAARSAALAGDHTGLRRQTSSVAAAVERAVARRPSLRVKLSPITGAPAAVIDRAAALTAAAPGVDSESIVRTYLSAHGVLFGLSAADLTDLVALGDSPGGASGLRMLRMEQRIADRPVFQSETRFLLDRHGRLVKVVGLLFPHARRYAPTSDAAWRLSALDAVARLLASTDESADHVAGPTTAHQVLFPLRPGVLLPAWSLVVFTTGDHDWYAIVDAETGDVLWRKNIRQLDSNHDARFRVYVQADGVTPADSPAPASPNTVTPGSGTQFGEISPTIVSMHTAMDAAASPDGWIDDCPGDGCTPDQTQTLGNNVLACLDRTVGGDTNVCDTDANSVLDGNGRPTGNPDTDSRNRDFLGTAPRDFETNYLPPPQGGPGGAESGQTATGTGPALDQFRRGAVTQLFYVSNWYHDRLFALGFDEAAGNFQRTHHQGGGGLDGDRVLADAQDGSGTNNANFATPPDGTSGRMQMFRFTGPTVDRDGDLDTEIVIHELTHGTSNRLVGNAAGLNWHPARGMGEGWSDFYALALLNDTNADDPDGQYGSGAYATYKLISGYEDNYLYGIRRFPYSTDNAVNPLTWADVDDVTIDLGGGIPASPIDFNANGGMEVHNSGELWALSLWEVRGRVIADPAGANGDVPSGNQTMLQLVTDGLKMTPIDPTFVEARDALFDADCATNACANEESIWSGFADRGLGYGAATPYNVMFGYTAPHMGVTESFSLPYLDIVDSDAHVVVDDGAGNGNGALDPGEPVLLTVTLTNPWRAASKSVPAATATLTTATPGVTIFDDTATYGAIPPLGTATGDSFTIALDGGVFCGGTIDFTLTTDSDLGTTSTSFSLRVGAANGTDSVITYTRNTSLPIPDGRPLAVFDQMSITDDLAIADLDFRVDSLTHTFTGDLTVMLRSPDGLGVDLISLIGALTDGGPGDNLTGMVIDDDLTPAPSNDMVLATGASAPFTGSWVPVFNGVWPPLAGFPPADPVGNLTRFDGLSTAGTWSVAVSDQIPVDTGTLNAWSLLVTPVHFDCTPFSGAAEVSATKTVTGDFSVGGTITYTVTLTNDGTAAQADNPGDELADVLPSELTLVSAGSTSGTTDADVGTNTVTWNGSMAPLGDSVTVTIEATIDAGTAGSTVSNQGSVAYDSDDDGTNDATVLTDDPSVGGTADPTTFTVAGSPFLAAALEVDPAPLSSDGNGVFEAGEQVEVAPAWHNNGDTPQSLSGVASNLTGPAGPTYDILLDDADYGTIGAAETASCQVTGTCYTMEIMPTGGERPTLHWDAVFDETLSDSSLVTWTLHLGDSFVDVPRSSLFYPAIETVLHAGVVETLLRAGLTGGCTGAAFCPTAANTRAEITVFLLKAAEGPGFIPPPCVEHDEIFLDVPFDHPLCPWIEGLAGRQVTSGCGGSNYCPDAAVTRAQLAVLLLRTLEGSQYTPPPCTGDFGDVPCSSLFAAWIEELFERGITSGCDASPPAYCPAAVVTRQHMAAFVTKTFGLVLYGP